MNKKNAYYDNRLVFKPWGHEHVVYRYRNILSVTLLNINPTKSTSLHCHPNKKTGFVLLNGKALIQLGLWKSERKIYKSPSKLMIRTGLFHSIKCVSKKPLLALEFETPINKNDLVRFKDNYGRAKKPYEGKSKMKKIKNEIFFKVPKKTGVNKYSYKKIDLTIEKHKNKKQLMKKSKDTIFAILNGGLVDKKNQYVLSPGDIVKTDTIKKLSKEFDIKNELIILTCKKNNEKISKN